MQVPESGVPASGRGASVALGDPDRDQLIGQLTGGIAHDFNNLLATVLGCLELMERRTEDPERLRSLIQRASAAIDRAAELTSTLVQFSRREPLPPTVVDVPTALNRVTPLIRSALGRRVSLELATLPCTAWADPTMLEASILALCLTGRRALPDGGTLHLSIESAPGEGAACIVMMAQGARVVPGDLTLLRRAAMRLGAELLDERAADETLRLSVRLPSAAGPTSETPAPSRSG